MFKVKGKCFQDECTLVQTSVYLLLAWNNTCIQMCFCSELLFNYHLESTHKTSIDGEWLDTSANLEVFNIILASLEKLKSQLLTIFQQVYFNLLFLFIATVLSLSHFPLLGHALISQSRVPDGSLLDFPYFYWHTIRSHLTCWGHPTM